MKKRRHRNFLIGVFVFLFAVPGILPVAAKDASILNVDNVSSDPGAFQGQIIINGVVAYVAEDSPPRIAIIDTREARICKITGCAKFYLPVFYEGNLPGIWEEVDVEGEFVKHERGLPKTGLIFKASSIKSKGKILP